MEAAKEENKEIKVRLLKINETAFFIDSLLLQKVDNEALHTSFDVEVGVNLPKSYQGNTFELKTVVRYYHSIRESSEDKISKPKRKKALEIETSNFFEFDNLDEYLTFRDDGIVDKFEVLPILLNISIGALRGITVTKTAGTCLSNYPLPIINIDILRESPDNSDSEKDDSATTTDISPK